MVFLFDLQKCGKILPSGVSSRSGSEDLSLYPPYSFNDHVKSWRLCIFIITGKEDCFEILLLHAGECIPWKHNRWYSVWTAICFPPPASYTVILFRLPFFSCIFMNLKVIFACYSIYAVYLAEGLDKYKSRVSSSCWHASMTEWARHSPSRNWNHKRRGALALSQDLLYQLVWKAS